MIQSGFSHDPASNNATLLVWCDVTGQRWKADCRQYDYMNGRERELWRRDVIRGVEFAVRSGRPLDRPFRVLRTIDVRQVPMTRAEAILPSEFLDITIEPVRGARRPAEQVDGFRGLTAAEYWSRANQIEHRHHDELAAGARDAALARSQKLCKRHLTDAQKGTLSKHYFDVQSKSGKVYRIYTHTATANVYLMDRGRHAKRYCAAPVNVPLWDALLAQKLLLECNEGYFLGKANATPCAPCGPIQPSIRGRQADDFWAEECAEIDQWMIAGLALSRANLRDDGITSTPHPGGNVWRVDGE